MNKRSKGSKDKQGHDFLSKKKNRKRGKVEKTLRETLSCTGKGVEKNWDFSDKRGQKDLKIVLIALMNGKLWKKFNGL